jgi:hypothetical protein
MHFIKSIPDFFIIAIFIIWAVFSVLSQSTSQIKNKLKRNDLLNVLPNYKFFCPNPIKQDYFLYYRELFADNSWSAWKKINLGKKIPILCLLWNPLKKERKIFYRIVKDIKGQKNEKRRYNNANCHLHLSEFVASYAASKSFQLKIVSREFRNDQFEEKDLYTTAS